MGIAIISHEGIMVSEVEDILRGRDEAVLCCVGKLGFLRRHQRLGTKLSQVHRGKDIPA